MMERRVNESCRDGNEALDRWRSREVSEERAGFMGHQTGRVKKPRGHEEAGGDVRNEHMKERVGQWEG